MRKTLLLTSLAVCLTGCAPKGNPEYRAREERPYPDPTLGTTNHESSWYRTQMLASPSAPTAPSALPDAKRSSGSIPKLSVSGKPAEMQDAAAAKAAAKK